ncbi:MAG: GAF domain-containing sensor histidine kinase, partial [Deltaproteobacteria bacterium]|nr:GAF domain-containing sensor histidine kinase [Deltaproteobacteria bacterium]
GKTTRSKSAAFKHAYKRPKHCTEPAAASFPFRKNREDHLRQLIILHEITSAITSTLELPNVLDRLLKKLDRLLPYAASTVRLFDEQKILKPIACRNIRPTDWKAGYGTGFVNELLERKAPVMSVDVQSDPRSRGPELFRDYGFVSFIAIPLIVKKQIIGILSFYTKTTHHFTGQEINFLSTLAAQVAMVISNSQLYEQTRRQRAQNANLVCALKKENSRAEAANKYLGALNSINSVASRSLNLNAVLEEVIKRITRIFDFDCTRVFILDTNRNELLLQASFETEPKYYINNKCFSLGQGIIGKVAQTGRPLMFRDVSSDPEYLKLSHSKTNIKAGLRFFAVFPIKTKSKILGCIDFASQEQRQLSQSEIRLIKSMIGHIVIAVENVNLFDATKQKVGELSALYSLARAMSKSVDLNSLLRRIMNEVLTIFQFESARIYLYNPQDNGLNVLADRHFPKVNFPRATGLISKVVRDERPIFFEDIPKDPYYRRYTRTGFALQYGFKSGFYLPIKSKGHVVGVITFLSKRIHRFSSTEKRIIDCIVDHLGATVENAQLYEVMARSQQQLQDLAERLQLAREQERSRLARRLHDDLGQALAAFKMELDKFTSDNGGEFKLQRQVKKHLFRRIDSMIANMRRLASRLRPPVLDGLDLKAAIKQAARDFQERTGVRCVFRDSVGRIKLNQSQSIAMLRILQEALNNVERHSKANRVDINWTRDRKGFFFKINDNGIGIKTSALRHTESLGIIGMRERALLCGGTLKISATKASGTTLYTHFPSNSRTPHESITG